MKKHSILFSIDAHEVLSETIIFVYLVATCQRLSSGPKHVWQKIEHTFFYITVQSKSGRVGKGASATCPPDSGTLVGTLRFTLTTHTCFVLELYQLNLNNLLSTKTKASLSFHSNTWWLIPRCKSVGTSV